MTGVLGPLVAASFYIPFTIASSIDLLSINLGNMLAAEMTRAHGKFNHHTCTFVLRTLLIIAAMSASLFLAAPLLLGLFGAAYRANGVGIMRVFMVAAALRAAIFLSIAAARGQARGRLILVLQSVTSVGTMVLGLALMPHLGSAGMASAWLGASATAAIVAVPAEFRYLGASLVVAS